MCFIYRTKLLISHKVDIILEDIKQLSLGGGNVAHVYVKKFIELCVAQKPLLAVILVAFYFIT